ncbi:short-chain dehydrogenase [Xylanibacillus composti]|uniref:Short-chain dehydrogenase n=1 Tax=Xylanibacillus composti TaxID=1572762 RepID=A0A8J4M2F6_9BACL|nr:short-chain dehydrogenase [Xylanibacillus composti]GIQ69619.1 short-chain dehydrogenase [Xylanibacillus composti]
MGHALVVGGSGMLRGVSIWLAECGFKVSVVGRELGKLQALAADNSRIIPVMANYYDPVSFSERVEQAVKERGTFDLMVAWLHSRHSEILQQLILLNRGHGQGWSIYHILGSRDPAGLLREELSQLEGICYRQVQLGSIEEDSGTRWLTHAEIASGVISAIRSTRSYYAVGRIPTCTEEEGIDD